MGFPGTWMTESESMIYRVVPKCACSTIGQIMFYSDHSRFFDGDIHDSTGRHLHRGIDLRSYDSESTRGPANSGAGVPGVAGADKCGVSAPVAASITAPQLSSQLSFLPPFFWYFLANVEGV